MAEGGCHGTAETILRWACTSGYAVKGVGCETGSMVKSFVHLKKGTSESVVDGLTSVGCEMSVCSLCIADEEAELALASSCIADVGDRMSCVRCSDTGD